MKGALSVVVSHAGERRPMRQVLGAALILLAAACTTDPPTDPLLPVFDVEIAGAPADGVVLDGASVQLTASAIGPANAPLDDREIAWTSAATDIATVDSEGHVETRGLGDVEIRASSEGITRALALSVREGTTVPVQGSARTVTLLDGLLRLIIPVGAAPGGTLVHARRAVTWPANARILAGSVVEIGPVGTEFAEAMIAGVSFVPTEIPVAERSALRLYGLEATGQWVELPQPDVDLVLFRVEADLMRLTTVAIFRPVVTP